MVSVEFVPNPYEYETELKRLLLKYDDSFVPPLTARSSTTQTDGLDTETSDSIRPYLRTCLDQELIIAREEGAVVGFLSFYVAETKDMLEEYSPCVYVSTTIVEQDSRQSGVATAMNRILIDNIVPNRDVTHITRRTWSTNRASRRYIESLGFDCIKRVPDDREEGVDSLYYAKPTVPLEE